MRSSDVALSRSGFSSCTYIWTDGESGTLLTARADIPRYVLDRTIIPVDEYKMFMRKMQLVLDKVPSPAPLRYVITVGPIRGGRAVDADVEVARMQIQRLCRVGESWCGQGSNKRARNDRGVYSNDGPCSSRFDLADHAARMQWLCSAVTLHSPLVWVVRQDYS